MNGRVFRGVKWSAIERFSVQFIQFFISIILARLLTPADFGLIALTTVFLAVLQTINEIGFGAALIQKQDRDELDYNSVFFLNIGLGITLYLILFLSAPWIQKLFNTDNLTVLLRYIGLNLIITSLVVVQRTILIIKVDFKTQAKCSLIATLVSGLIGVYAAYRGVGVMALVLQSILNNTVNVLCIWVCSTWRPNLLFSLTRLKSLFKFAYKLIIAQLVNNIFGQLYSFIIGKFFSPTDLGLYNRASSFESLSTNNITQVVQRVSMPLLCEKQNSKIELQNELLKFIRYTAFIVYPLLFILIFFSKPIILVILSIKWIGVVPLMPYVCVCGFCFVISSFNINVFNATGKTGWALQCEIVKKSIFIVIIVTSVFYGFMALVKSLIVIAILEVIINMIYTRRQIGTKLIMQILNVLPIFVLALVSGFLGYTLSSNFDNNVIKLLVGISSLILFYVSLSYYFNVNNFREVLRHLGK